MLIYFNNKILLNLPQKLNNEDIFSTIENKLNLQQNDYYCTTNGKKATDFTQSHIVHVVPRLCGGKGGFGSMLRAIGAQIEKTTNREACRDLSGRRLRDINEEKRLKTWIDKQAQREQEDEERKQKKLERLMQKPKHDFKDDAYDKERADLPERLEDAITQGLQASASTSGKRKCDDNTEKNKKKKKKALWVDDELDDLSDSDMGDSSSDEDSKPKIVEKADVSSST